MSNGIRFIYINLWQKGTILDYSSKHPQFPVEDSEEDTKVLYWRTRNGADSGNGLFVVDDNSKHIDFDEGGAELTATLAKADYTGASLAAEIKTKLDAAGALTYTVTYSETDAKFTIAASANFTLRFNTGTHKATDISDLCGYSDAANKTGSDSYESDNRVIHYPKAYIDRDLLTAYEYDFIALLNHNISDSATIKIYGADNAAFTTNLVSDTIAHNSRNIFKFLTASRTKRYVRLSIEDPANPNSYIQIGTVFLGKYFEPNKSFVKAYGEGNTNSTEPEYSDSMILYAGQERPSLKGYYLPFRGLNTASKNEFLSLQEICATHKAFIACFDYDSPNNNSILARNDDLGQAEYQHVDNWNIDLSITEVL